MPDQEPAAVGVTVIIPCYNYAHYLPAAIESCLRQSHRPLEVLVVDDSSTDNSVAVAESYGPPVRCLRQANQGVGAARNHGMRAAAHDFVMFLDADDMLAEGAVAALLQAYQQADEEPGLVAGCANSVDSQGQSLGLPAEPAALGGIRTVTLQEAVLCTPFPPTVLAHRQYLLALGGFETNDALYRGSEDKAMWIEVAAGSRPPLLLRQVILHYRVHGSSMSHNGKRQLASSQAILRRAQERHGSQLPQAVWKRAWAFSMVQQANFYSAIGDYRHALSLLLQSMARAPRLNDAHLLERCGRGFRLRRLFGVLKRWLLPVWGSGRLRVP